MYRVFISLLSFQSISNCCSICFSFAQFTLSKIFSRSMKAMFISLPYSFALSPKVLIIAIASLVPRPFPESKLICSKESRCLISIHSMILDVWLIRLIVLKSELFLACGFFSIDIMIVVVKSSGHSPASYITLLNFINSSNNSLLGSLRNSTCTLSYPWAFHF